MRVQLLLGLFIMGLGQGCDQQKAAQSFPRLTELDVPAPQAKVVPYQANYHGYTLTDDFNWLKDKDYPEVNDAKILDYLKAENQYYGKFLQPHRHLVDTLFEEFKGRIEDKSTSLPWIKNGYQYQWQYLSGHNYRTWTRRKLDSEVEEVFLDEPKLAKNFDYFSLGAWDISPDNRYLAYAVDTDGSERQIIKIVDLETKQYLPDELTDAAGALRFGQDSKSVIYAKLQADVWRTNSINLHSLGTPQDQDKVLITEPDESIFLDFYLTSSEQYLVLSSGDSSRTQVAVLPMKDLHQQAKLINKLADNHRLSVDHGNGQFYLLSNHEHVNFAIYQTAEKDLAKSQWQTVFAGSDNRYFTDLKVFKDFVVVEQNIDGLPAMTVLPNDQPAYQISFPEKVASMYTSYNPEFSQTQVRISYESMVTPNTVFDFDTKSKQLLTRKVQKIPSGYDKQNYHSERFMAPTRDGTQVPVTLVYKKDLKKDHTNPLYLYGYGAYASGLWPDFSVTRLSLLDRGMVFAYAHVRGGDELGYQWYLDGKLDKRPNTFNDFVDVAKHLVAQNYTSEGNISISGGSAGGELVGAAVIQAPDLWRSATLDVPFVDVLNTMLDASLPLTPPEWSEWGNPIESKQKFELIRSYSPYDNIAKRDYPPMLVTGGLNDPRVTYWEPAKWTAKMRQMKTDDNLLVMRINMGAGHYANSGRYGRLKDMAEEYAFALLAHGITE